MAGKSLEERLADTEVRIRQLETRRQTITQQLRQQERKDRTRRLIQIGGIMAKLGVDTVEKAQALQKEFESQLKALAWLRSVTESTHAEEGQA